MRSYLTATLRWAGLIAGLWCGSALVFLPGEIPWAEFASTLGYALAFGSFGGGVAIAHFRRDLTVRQLLSAAVAAGGIGLMTWGLIAHANPALEVWQGGYTTESAVPVLNPDGLRQLRAAAVANPHPMPAPVVGSPERWPAEWISYQIAVPIVAGVFVVLNAVLGWFVAAVTFGFDRPWMRRMRWFTGIVSAFGFIAMDGYVYDRTGWGGAGSGTWWTVAIVVPHVVALLGLVVVWRRWEGRAARD